MKTYGLDPAHYVSAPQLSWDAMLKKTAVELELVSDPEMFKMIDNGLRGGIAVITKRYAEANNPLIGPSYNPNVPRSYIVGLDANNLYGWAMSMPLPYGGFKWADDFTIRCLETGMLTRMDEESEDGFIIECDLSYPNDLHEKHNDYPLAPERMWAEMEYLSKEQLTIRSRYKTVTGAELKLIPNLFNKKVCPAY